MNGGGMGVSPMRMGETPMPSPDLVGPTFAKTLTVMKRSMCTLAILLAGCVSHTADIGKSPVQPNPQPRLARDVHVRVRELSSMLDQYNADLRALPGKTDSEHRRAAAKLFGDLSEILPTLEGPNPGGAFRQQLAIVDGTRTQLEYGSDKLSYEATEDTGLRTVFHALDALQREQFYDHQEIAAALAAARAKIDELDTIRGPLHRAVAQEVLEGFGQIVSRMQDVLKARLGNRRA